MAGASKARKQADENQFPGGRLCHALCFTSANLAEARASPAPPQAEISAIQVSAVQQELTDAALACGPRRPALFNRFQTVFNKELRRSDALMLAMFKRLNGSVQGQCRL